MGSKRNLRRKSCTGKTRFETSKMAHRAMSSMSHKEYRGKMNVYKCRFCKKYHFGRAPKKHMRGR
jgi:hypothetical protein